MADDPRYKAATEREPPHSIDAEQALLGSLLIHNAVIVEVSDIVRPEHFFEPAHGRIYEAILSLSDQSKTANPTTLRPFFTTDPALKDVGGADYLKRLTAAAVTIINVVDYAKLLADLATRRALIGFGYSVVNTALDAKLEETADSQLADAEKRLFAISLQRDTEIVSIGAAAVSAINMSQTAANAKGGVTGLTTGLHDLDRRLGGMQKQNLIICAGRPAMGKSIVGSSAAWANARIGQAAAMWSLEMSSDENAWRIIANIASIPLDRLVNGNLDEEEWMRAVDAQQRMRDAPLHILPTPGINIGQMRAQARRLKRKHDIKLAVVDHIQLIRPTRETLHMSRVYQVEEITNGLKAMAKELDISVLALSQLSRDVEKRDDKRPHMADLRDSGSIEQDADVVMFLYREAYYMRRNQPRQNDPGYPGWLADYGQIEHVLEINIEKQRNGPGGIIEFYFDGQYSRIVDAARDDPNQPYMDL